MLRDVLTAGKPGRLYIDADVSMTGACSSACSSASSRPPWWERRGFFGSLFRAPVLLFGQPGEPQFRYLREYLESAHRLADEPLRGNQLWALDALDSALALSVSPQAGAGEILVIDDKQMFHGRTSFSDFLEAGPYEPGAGSGGPGETWSDRSPGSVWSSRSWC
jgi:hypothetical protein